MELSEIQRVNVSRAEKWHPGFPKDSNWNGADWSNAMCGEAGEAANIVKKLRRRETGVVGRKDKDEIKLLMALAEELADVLCYLVLVAAYYEIDLETAVQYKFNKVSKLQGFPERL